MNRGFNLAYAYLLSSPRKQRTFISKFLSPRFAFQGFHFPVNCGLEADDPPSDVCYNSYIIHVISFRHVGILSYHIIMGRRKVRTIQYVERQKNNIPITYNTLL